MKLQRKTSIIVIIAFALLLLASLVFYYTHILSEFLAVERQSVRRDANRVVQAIEAEREQMRVTAIDWAQWDDMYKFMAHQTNAFKESWSTYESYKALRITDTLFFDLKRQMVFGVRVDFENEQVVPLQRSDSLVSELVKLDPIFSFQGEVPSRALFAKIKDDVSLLASSPILDSNRSKPSRGTMIIVKHVNQEFLEKIATQTRLTMTYVPKPPLAILEHLSTKASPEDGPPRLVTPINEDLIYGYTAITDHKAMPIDVIKISEQRPIYQQGLATLKWFFGFWFIASATAVGLILIMLNRFILGRLNTIGTSVQSIRTQKNFDVRLAEDGNDELSQLSFDINAMLGSLGVAHHDVKVARDQAQAANLAKSRFISRLSHELRTPVAGIIGLNDLILRREPAQAIRDLIQMSKLSADSLLSVVNEFLDFSKAEAGELVFQHTAFIVRDVLRETMQVVAARLEGKYKPEELDRLELMCEVSPSVPPQLIGDPIKLKQILINLLGNSIKFTQHGHVGLRMGADLIDGKARLNVEVWDTGCGIEPTKLESIFLPFKQVEDKSGLSHQGTGLGLAIVKQFAEGMGGTVSVTSAPGSGSIFHVSVPFEFAGESDYLGTTLHASQVSWPREIILVANDGMVSESILSGLRRLGANPLRLRVGAPHNLADHEEQLLNANPLIVSEESLGDTTILNILKKRAGSGLCTIAMIRPSRLDLREMLYELRIPYILTTPIMADDLILAFQGRLPRLHTRDAAVEAPVRSGSKKLKVLLADDTPTNLLIIEDMLTEAGHEVVCVRDGLEVVALAKAMLEGKPDAAQFDVVITDISMPFMNGDEATREIRRLEEAKGGSMHVPIIAVTANALREEQEKILQCGVTDILTKPVRPEELLRCLGHIDRKDQSAEISVGRILK